MEHLEKYETEIIVLLSTAAVSHLLSQWIQENYQLLEYIFLILLFGLIHEGWSSIQSDDALREFIEFFDVDSATAMQVALLWFIGATVLLSLWLRNLVESVFGPLSVIQLLAVIVGLSRAFVNVYRSQNLLAVCDGERGTFATYTAGLLAFVVSWQIRDYYATYTWLHNMLSIWLPVTVSWLLFYQSSIGESLPNFTEEAIS